MNTQRTKSKAPNAIRHDKAGWAEIIKPMLDAGKLYREISAHLGTSPSTVCRFVWAQGWADATTHRASTRTQILNAKEGHEAP